MQGAGKSTGNSVAARQIVAIFFDIGDTLVFDQPSLKERSRLALQMQMPAFEERVFAQAWSAAERSALEEYLLDGKLESHGAKLRATKTLLQVLGIPGSSESALRLLTEMEKIPSYRTAHPMAINLLDQLTDRGFVLGAISDWDQRLPEVLEDLQLRTRFQTIVASEMVGFHKPDPRLFEAALRSAGVEASQSLHVGDWDALDGAGARAAGMQTLLFDHADRSQDCPFPRVTEFEELASALLALP